MAGPNDDGAFRQVAVIGPTAWGTTLAILLARNRIPAFLITRSDDEARTLARARENVRRLPGIPFPEGLHPTADIASAIPASDLIVFAVPSQTLRANVRRLAPLMEHEPAVLSGVKGLELETGNRMSDVICEEIGRSSVDRIAVLSGPNLSHEIARGLPANTVVASHSLSLARQIQSALMSPRFRIYSQTDVTGVELGGALKNIIAIGAGMGDGLEYGANAKAAFLTRGLAEITRLGVALGAAPATFMGLAGMGDLVATCTSPLSRNRRLGEAIARGVPLADALRDMDQAAEGVEATSVALLLARRAAVEMPITETMARVLFDDLDPRVAVEQLMTRDPKEETITTL